MNIIIKDGLSSKHTLKNTRDAFLLALNQKQVQGIMIKAQLSKDNHLIVNNTNELSNPNEKEILISDLTYAELKTLEQSSINKKDHFITLNQLFQLYQNSKKIIVLYLNEQQANERKYINTLLQVYHEYPNTNLYLAVPTPEIILFLKSIEPNLKTGIIIDNNASYWNLPVDFYLISQERLDKQRMKEKEQEKKTIFINLENNASHLWYHNSPSLFYILDNLGLMNQLYLDI